MEKFSTEFWMQMIIYGATFGFAFGGIRTKLNYMEKKLDKHNCLVERMVAVEQSTKSAHHRIEEINEKL